MKFTTTLFAVLAAVAPTASSLPSDPSARQNKIATCAAETCLTTTNGQFNGCATNDLVCLCKLEQAEVSRYVSVVQPCIDGDAGHKACTAGGIYTYKDVLKNVCDTEEFGYKKAIFPEVPTTV
ncbi:hypothetical protein CC86DRAFT_98507 [Ophiobolus disseminans]|uniref:Extracellular membrane protein CFEM domain-containing protein n=1 Tax=Ophiobolus disseminans TaxID=1469910 RepID=A0A6A6ZKJ1_9PLEO|nr:hypothetical protein CC86DRAFT_98507 [Ophiobolus disseminans]